ncbi:hypothetical protein [Streptomyces sp. NPDC048659]|uniref:hypothetical protein n=1 Tax=Streptomyces sp. NPDC048659 TaxID=3155489 RepID=UPI00342A930A
MKMPTGRRSALAALAAVAALVLTAAPASAVPSTVWTVTPSPAVIAATNSANVTVNVLGNIATCAKSGFTATLHSATGNPAQVGSFGGLTFGTAATPCTGVLGPISVTGTAPWVFVAQDYTAATGVTKGYVDTMDLTVSGGIVIRAQGRAPASYTNATGRLVIDGTAGQLLITQTNSPAFPVGGSVIVKATYQLRVAGSGAIATIVGTAP